MEDKSKASSIAKALNTAYYHHGYAVSRSEAQHMGLNITCPDEELENLMWDVWKDYSREMKCDKEFNIVATIMTHPEAQARLNQINIVNLPANTPPQVAQNIIATVAQNSATIVSHPPIKVDELIATIESPRKAMAVYTSFNIAYWRDANMALAFNATAYSAGWETNHKVIV